MLPVAIWNWTASIALVVFAYPAANPPQELLVDSYVFVLAIKCLTNVVDDGLNKCKNPVVHWSLSLPTRWAILIKSVLCWLSSDDLYANSVADWFSKWYALKFVVVTVVL